MNSTPTIKDFGVRIAWDERADYFVAENPDIPACAAGGTTRLEALAHLEETFAVLKESYVEPGRSFPSLDSRLSATAQQTGAE